MSILSKTKSAIKKAASKVKSTASKVVITVKKVAATSKGKTNSSNLSKLIPVSSKSYLATPDQAAQNRSKLVSALRGSSYLTNVNRIVAEDTLKKSTIKSGLSSLSSSAKSNPSSNKLSISGKGNIVGGINRAVQLNKNQIFVPTKENIEVAKSIKSSLSSIDRGVPISKGFSSLSSSAKSNPSNKLSISGKGNIVGGIQRAVQINRNQIFVPTKENIAVARAIKSSGRSIDRALPIYSGFGKVAAAGRSVSNQRTSRLSISGKGNIVGGIQRTIQANKNQKFVPTKESKEVADALKKTSKIYAIGKGIKMIYSAAKSAGKSKNNFKIDNKDILSSIRESYIRNRKQDMSPKTAEQKAVAKAFGVSWNSVKTAASDPEVQAQATVLVASALTPAVISRTPNLINAARLRATGKYIPAEEIFSKQALQSELKSGILKRQKGAGLTTGYNPKRTIKAFKETRGKLGYGKKKLVAVTATDFPGKIQKSELVSDKLKAFLSKKGLPEDPGIYIAPYGKGESLFLRIGAKGSGYSYSVIPKVTFSKPSAYVVGFKKIGKYPKAIIKGKGFNITKTFQEKFGKGKSKPLITKRMTLGGTSEPEAVIPIGDRLYSLKTKKPLYTKIGKEIVPVYKTELRATLKNRLIYRARANRIKVSSKNTTKDIIEKLKKKGKYNDKLLSKIKKETTDLYSMSSGGGKSILVPIPFYKLSGLSGSSTSKLSSSSSLGKSSGVSSSGSSSKKSSSSSSSSGSSGRSSGSSGGSSGSSGGSGGSGSSSSSGEGSSGSSSGGSSSGGEQTRYSPGRKIPNKKKISLFRINSVKSVRKKPVMFSEPAYRQIAFSGNRRIEVNKNRNMNLVAARNYMSRWADNNKVRSFALVPKNSRATTIQRKLNNVNNKFIYRRNRFIEKNRFIRDKPGEKMKGNKLWL